MILLLLSANKKGRFVVMKEKCVLVKCGRIAVALSFTMLALVSEAKLKTVWDVDDYVQDGLVANYDGIKNAGKDNPHESTREEWVDLVSE
jgi:hypothetical protein